MIISLSNCIETLSIWPSNNSFEKGKIHSENETLSSFDTQISVDPWHEAQAKDRISTPSRLNCFSLLLRVFSHGAVSLLFQEGKSFFPNAFSPLCFFFRYSHVNINSMVKLLDYSSKPCSLFCTKVANPISNIFANLKN